MKAQQLELFDMDSIKKNESRPKASRFYYVVRRRNSEMLHYVSRDGAPVWCEHDTRNAQPMLFNTSQQARRAAKTHGGTDVKRWYWGKEWRRSEHTS